MYNQSQEEMQSEFNASFDYLQEAYGPTAQDAYNFAEEEDYAWQLKEDKRLQAQAKIEETHGPFHGPIYDWKYSGKPTITDNLPF